MSSSNAGAFIDRLRSGDSSVLDDILKQYGRTLLDIATIITGRQDLAKDAVQDVLINLWNNRSNIKIRSTFAGYLINAVRNRAISISRHEQAQYKLVTQEQDSYLDKDTNDLCDSENIERTADIHSALSTLPPRAREILLMRADLEMSYAEIADALGIAVNTVRVQLYNATRILAKKLGRWR